MRLLLFVHTDPRKTNRSATVRVQKGDYKIESNHVDSLIEVGWLNVETNEEGMHHALLGHGSPISFPFTANVYLKILKAGTEPHLTTYLVSV